MKRLTLMMLAALVATGMLASACGGGGETTTSSESTTPAPSTPAAAAPAADSGTAAEPGEARPKMVAPVRGQAQLGHLKPETKIDGDEVVTVFTVKNMANGAIAGLKIDEFWWDKADNPLPGDSQRLRQPLLPGEVATLELRTPRNSNMARNSYNFSHANGEIKTTLLENIEEPAAEGDEETPPETP